MWRYRPGGWVRTVCQRGAVAILPGDFGLAHANTSQEFTAAMTSAVTAGRYTPPRLEARLGLPGRFVPRLPHSGNICQCFSARWITPVAAGGCFGP